MTTHIKKGKTFSAARSMEIVRNFKRDEFVRIPAALGNLHFKPQDYYR